MSLVEAAAARLIPITAFRYAERTGNPLLVEDVGQNDRFSSDPYFGGTECCSLLVVPIHSQGSSRAMLLLENRHSRGAFSLSRLEAVKLIAGQLAVSLDNALLYDSLEQKVTERTLALTEANQHLEQLIVTDPLTGLANRRRFVEVLDAEWSRAMRQRSSMAIAFIDIDQFKLYNDYYGDLVGELGRCRYSKPLASVGSSMLWFCAHQA